MLGRTTKTRAVRTIIFMMVFVVLSGVVYRPASVAETKATGEVWWNASWSYRKLHTINSAAGAGTNYQVKIIAHYGAGTDSGSDVYLNSHSRSDFTDIRFTDDNATTPVVLDYWMESKTDSDKATFWVEVAGDLSTVSKNIFIYYGNASATVSTSNGTNTFLFFDDFSGASLDTNKWLAYNVDNITQSAGILSTNTTNKDPNKLIAYANGSGPTGDYVAMRARFQITGGSSVDQRIGLGVKTSNTTGQGLNYVLHDFTAKNKHQFLDDALAWGPDNGGAFASNTWYTEEVYYDGSNMWGRFDDGTWYSWARGGRTGYMALNTGGFSETVSNDWDFAAIRKIAAAEPAHGSWATEEQGSPVTIYRSVAPGATANLNLDNRTVTITGTTATFSSAMRETVGVGDVLQYNPGSGLTLAFVSGRTSSTVYTVQSVTGGTPTAASAGTAVSVFRAYTSLANAEAGIENTGIDTTLRNFDDWTAGGDATTDDVGKDLVATNQQWNIALYTNGVTEDSTAVSITGWTTGVNNFIKVYTPTSASEVGISQRHDGTVGGSGYFLNQAAYTIDTLTIANDYTVIDGLKIKAGSASYRSPIASNASNVVIKNNLLINPIGRGINVNNAGSQTIFNNIIVDTTNNSIYTYGIGTYLIYNNTALGSITYNGGGGTATAKNNFAKTYTGTFSGGFTNNASIDTTGNNGLVSLVASNQFINTAAGNENLHLKSGSALINVGTDLSGSFTADVDGATRSDTWDIGADELATQIFRSASPGVTSDLNTSTRTVTISGTTATFSGAMPDNVGVGDVLQYNPGSGLTLAFISGRTSSTVYTVQSVTGGAPTAASAGTAVSVFRAYTSLSNAEKGVENTGIDTTLRNFDNWTAGGDATTDDVGKDLVAANQQWNIALYANGTTADTTAANIEGWTAGISNYIRVYTPISISEVGVSQRHSGVWDDSKYHLVPTTSNSEPMSDHVSYTRIDGLQVRSRSQAADYSYGIAVGTIGLPARGVMVSNNIVFEGNSANRWDVGIVSFSPTYIPHYIWNNIVYGFNNATAGAGISVGGDYGTKPSYVYNNTISNCTTGISANYGTAKVINNLIVNTPTPYGSTMASGSDYNATDVNATTQGDLNTPAHDKKLQTFQFVNAAGNNFHLLPSDTAAKDAGADLSADTKLAFTTDIEGQTRPVNAWDIGADEAATAIYRSVAPGMTSDLNTSARTVTISGTTATFSGAMPDNVGVGDVLQYDSGMDLTLAFITGRTSSTVFTVQSANGGGPQSTPSVQVSVYRAYTSLANAESGIENTAINSTLRNFDNWTAGGDATTDDVGKDLVAANQQWNIALYANGTSADTTAVDIDGWTTGTNNSLKIFTPTLSSEVGISQRHAGVWNTNKYYLQVSRSYTAVIRIYSRFVKLDGLQVYATSNDRPEGIASLPVTTASDRSNIIDISNNIIKGSDPANESYGGVTIFGVAANFDWNNSRIWNNIVYDFTSTTSGAGQGIVGGSYGGTQYVYNNTTYHNNVGIENFYGGANSLTVKNNLSTGNVQADYYIFTPTPTILHANNVSGDGTSWDAAYANRSASFVNASGRDLHLTASDTAAKNAGADLSADASLAFTTDIDGAARTAPPAGGWDIGADEAATAIYRSVAAGATNPVADGVSSGSGMYVSESNLTFEMAQPDNIGVGDIVQFDSNQDFVIDSIVVISGRTDSTHYTIQTVTGGVPSLHDTIISPTWSIYRAYTSLANAESGIENTGIDATLRNFDDWTAGGDATTDDVGKNLVTANQQWNIALYANGTTPETNTTTMRGWTLGSSNYIKVYTPTSLSEVGISQRHSGKWDDTKFKIEMSAAVDYTRGILIRQDFVRIEGLQIKMTNNDYGYASGIYVDGSSYLTPDAHLYISSNLITGVTTTTGTDTATGIYLSYDSGTAYVDNNIITDFTMGSAGLYSSGILAYGTSYIYNNTLYNCIRGIRGVTGTFVAKNNLVAGASNTAFVGTFSEGTDYNATDRASMGYTVTGGGNTHDKLNQTPVFVNTSTGDYHLSASDTAAVNAGADLSADSNLAFTTDIDGQTRTGTWDIGADEFVATVPGAPTIGTATAGDAAQASVTFTPPASDGGSAITGYTVTSTPGNLTGTGASSPITVSGLTNGTAYTFTVHATNAIGNSAESAASNSVTPVAASFPTGWTKSYKLSINHTRVPGDLANFPVLVTANNLPDSIKTLDGAVAAQADGGDIRFSSDESGMTQLAAEVVSWTQNANPANSKAEIWVKLPNVSSTVDTDFYIWWSAGGAKTQPAATDTYGKNAVWSNGYAAVWHLNETGSNPTVYDSTSHTNNSTAQIWTPIANGKIVNAGSFGSGQSLAVDSTASYIQTGSLTFSSWISFSSVNGNGSPQQSIFYSNDGPANNAAGFGLGSLSGLADGKIHLDLFGSSWVTLGSNKNSWDASTWHYVAGVFDSVSGRITLYIDGAQDNSATGFTRGTTPYSTHFGVGSGAAFLGSLDESHVSSVTRSADWVAAEYNNQNSPSTFFVSVPGAPTIGTVTAGDAQASVTFTPPASDGGSAITGYTVTSTPGNLTGTGAASPITVSGLTNGTAYTFTVHATNAIGNSAESAASNSVTPAAAGITISGFIYDTDEITPITSQPPMKLAVGAETAYTTTAAADGSFSFAVASVPANGSVITIWINTGTFNPSATLVFKYGSVCEGGTANCVGLKLFKNQAIIGVDYSDTSNFITYADLQACNAVRGAVCADGDIDFAESFGTIMGNLRIKDANAKFSSWDVLGSIKQSDGQVMRDSESTAPWDLTDFTLSGGTFTAPSDLMTVSGNWSQTGGTFNNNGGTVTFDATDSGNTINLGNGNLNNVIFNGTNGSWSFTDSANTIDGDLTVTAGTLSGTSSITVNGGDVSGAGTINLTGGTFTLTGTPGANWGSNTNWTFYDLTIGGATNTTYTAIGTGGITILHALAIDTGDTLNAGNKIWTLSGSNDVFGYSTGGFTAANSTFVYAGTNVTQVRGNRTYYNLTINAASGSPTFNSTGDTIVTNAFNITNGTFNQNLSNMTTGNVTVGANGIWQETSSGDIILTGNVSNAGTINFNASGGTSCQNDNDVVEFKSSDTTVRSLSGAGTWSLEDVAVSYLNATVAITVKSGTNVIGNTGSWNWSGCGITLSGNLYAADETTPITSGTLKLSVAGGTAVTTTAGALGAWSFTGVNPTAGQVITIWVDANSTTGASNATLVFKYGTTCEGGTADCTGLKLFQSNVIIGVDYNNTANYITNADLAPCDNDTGTGCADTDIGFTANSVGPTLGVSWTSSTLRIKDANAKFSPASATVKNYKQSAGTFTGGVNSQTVNGNFELLGGAFTSTSGTLTVGGNFTNYGTFNHNSGTVTFNGSGDLVIFNASSFNNIVFNNPSGSWTVNGVNSDLVVTGNLTMTAGSLVGAGSLKVLGGNVTGDGSIIFTSGSGVFLGLSQISAGNNHTCAISDAGYAYCWGSDTAGQLGDGQSGTGQATPVKVLKGGATGADTDGTYLINVKQITAGSSYTCAISNSGYTYCWGVPSYGKLGDGQKTVARTTPIKVLKGAATGGDTDGTYLINMKQIAAGSSHTCAVSNAGMGYCWGHANRGQLGDGQISDRTTPVLVLKGAATGVDTDSTYLINIKQITAGDDVSCAISDSGKTYCWGYAWYGQLGDGQTSTNRSTPVLVQKGLATGADTDGAYLINLKQIVTGGSSTCAISNSGLTYCWGYPSSGQLGDGQTSTTRTAPVLVLKGAATGADTDNTNLINLKQIAIGGSYACAISNSGKTYCWGYAWYGQVGDGQTSTDRSTPVLVQKGLATGSDTDNTNLVNLKQISTGSSFACAISNSGMTYCWGYGQVGALGDGQATADQTAPVLVQRAAAAGSGTDSPNFLNLKQVATGGSHTCAISNSGYTYCWGEANSGQIGDGQTTAARTTPIKVLKGEALGADTDGTYLINIKQISTGGYHTCAVSNSGLAYCWGKAGYGQTGDGLGADFHDTPILVVKGEATGSDTDGTHLTNLKQISSGWYFTCAVSNSGKVYCFGESDDGQLGNGSYNGSDVPVLVLKGVATGADTDNTNLFNINQVSAGYGHTCAVSNSGMTYCWGQNYYGQVGDGLTYDEVLTPIKVLKGAATGADTDNTYLTNLKQISAGNSHTCAISNSGMTYCWGQAYSGQLGDGQTSSERTSPVKVLKGAATGADTDNTYLINIKQITSGGVHTCAISNSDKTYCWGGADSVGDGQIMADRTSPVLVLKGSASSADTDGTYLINIKQIVGGNSQTCAVSNSGMTYCWGAASSGMLGDGQTLANRTTPTSVVSKTASKSSFEVDGTGNFGGNTPWTFDVLKFGSGSTGTITSVGSGSISITGNLVVSSGQTFSAGSKPLAISGSITNDGTFTSTSGTLTLTGTFNNNGTFNHNNGTVNFTNGEGSAILGSSSTTFYNLADTVPGSLLLFANDGGGTTPKYTIAGTATITGTADNHIAITSDNRANQWLVHFNSPQTAITHVTVSWSGCDGTSATATLDSESTNGGNNGTCWVIPATAIYRSAAPGMTSNLNASTRTVTISGTTATFSGAMPDNVGVGDVLQYNPGSGLTLAFISGRTSSTVYSVQSSSGGTPIAAPEGTAVSVFRAYTSLANAEAGIENTGIDASIRNFDDWTAGGDATTDDVGKDLVASNQQWNIAAYANGTTADSSRLPIFGWTTSDSNYLRFYTPTSPSEVGTSQRHTGKWDNTKFYMSVSANAPLSVIDIGYVRMDGLQMYLNFGEANDSIISITGTGRQIGIEISNNILRSAVANNVDHSGALIEANYGAYQTGTGKIFNNILDEKPGTYGTAIYINTLTDSSITYYVYNNTISGTAYGIVRGDFWPSFHMIAKNNLLTSVTNPIAAKVGCSFCEFAAGSDYNATDASSLGYTVTGGGNMHDRVNQTFSFVNAGSRDFHLAASDIGAMNVGADLSADANLAFTTDIDGETRPAGSWDIGADEYVAVTNYIQSGYRLFQNASVNFGSGGYLRSNPITSGSVTNTGTSDNDYIYVAGYQYGSADGGCAAGRSCWRLEKRSKITGNLDQNLTLGSSTPGVIVSLSGVGGEIGAVAVDSDYIYLAGNQDNAADGACTNVSFWGCLRIEKRSKTTGALISAFQAGSSTGGVAIAEPSGSWLSVGAGSITYDDNYLYIGESDSSDSESEWRIEKRNKVTGALISAFDSDGIIQFHSGASNWDGISSIAVDNNYLYVGGSQDGACPVSVYCSRLEKRDKTTGALVGAFDSDGVILSPITGTGIGSIVIDSSNIYIGGSQPTGNGCTTGNNCWRIEKRDITTGALVNAFDSDGIITSDPTNSHDYVDSIKIDSNYLYIGGTQGGSADGGCTAGNSCWRVEKRDKVSGSLVNSLTSGGSTIPGVILSNPSSGSDPVSELSIDTDYVFLIGSESSVAGCGTNFCWRVEKHDITSGTLVTSSVTTDVGSPLANLNTAATLTNTGDMFRLRMLMHSDMELAQSGENFKLQYAVKTGETYGTFADVTTSTPISFKDNAGLSDCTNLTANANDPTHLSHTVIPQTYEEANNFTNSIAAITAGNDAMWDFSLYDNGAPQGTTYAFRIVKSDGSTLNSYTYYPEVTTKSVGSSTFTQAVYRWYQNNDSLDPLTSYASENTPYIHASPNTPIRLRLGLDVAGSALSANSQAFALQWSHSPNGGWGNIGSTSGTFGIKAKNNPTATDGGTISSTMLNGSNVKGLYSEAPVTGLNPNVVNIGQRVEYDFAIDTSLTTWGDTYYFRLVKSNNQALDTYTYYPALTVGRVLIRGGHPGMSSVELNSGGGNPGTGGTGQGGGGGATGGVGSQISAGPNNSSSAVDAGGIYPWTAASNALVDDSSYANVGSASTMPLALNNLKLTVFNFNVPQGATVNGIKVEVKGYASASSGSTTFIQDNVISIIKNGSVGSTNKKRTAVNWSTAEGYISYGGTSDTWGETWTPADINSSLFGLALGVVGKDGWEAGVYAYVNHVRITVYYTPVPDSGSSGGGNPGTGGTGQGSGGGASP